MLCTMCMFGTTKTWKCGFCGETMCRHINTCSKCKAPKPEIIFIERR